MSFPFFTPTTAHVSRFNHLKNMRKKLFIFIKYYLFVTKKIKKLGVKRKDDLKSNNIIIKEAYSFDHTFIFLRILLSFNYN